MSLLDVTSRNWLSSVSTSSIGKTGPLDPLVHQALEEFKALLDQLALKVRNAPKVHKAHKALKELLDQLVLKVHKALKVHKEHNEHKACRV